MTTLLQFARDVQGMNAYAPRTADNKYSATLTNGVATSITVPSNFANWIVVFSNQPGTNVWVDLTGATAAIPAGGTLTATTSELNPGQRLVTSGTKVSVITDNATADFGVMLYAIS